MKVETNLKSGNVLDGAADSVSQSVHGIASFVNQANQQANNLANGAANLTQTAWDRLAGWVKSI